MLSEVFSKASRCVEERTGLFVYGPHALPRHKASKKAGDHVKTAQPPPPNAKRANMYTSPLFRSFNFLHPF